MTPLLSYLVQHWQNIILLFLKLQKRKKEEKQFETGYLVTNPRNHQNSNSTWWWKSKTRSFRVHHAGEWRFVPSLWQISQRWIQKSCWDTIHWTSQIPTLWQMQRKDMGSPKVFRTCHLGTKDVCAMWKIFIQTSETLTCYRKNIPSQ